MEKQYKPSRKRLEKARKEGNIPKSQYLSQSAGLSLGLLVCLLYIGNSWVEHKILVEYIWVEGYKAPAQLITIVASKYYILTLKLLLIIATCGLLTEAAQTGALVSFELLAFKLDRVNPVSGLKRIVENLKKSWLVVLKLIITILALSWFFFSLLRNPDALIVMPSEISGRFFFKQVFRLSALLSAVFIAFAFADYYFQRRKWFKNVGMSLQDVRQESKDEEGDPLIKSLRKYQHRELLQQDLVKRIRSARVVIVERAAYNLL